jgi:tellurite resistance protein
MRTVARFPPTLFGIPFGLAGLAGVWHQMAGFYGTPGAVSDVLFIAAAGCWLLLVFAVMGSLIRAPRAILAELRDPVLSPFWSLPSIVGMVLAIGLEPYAHGAAKVAFVVFFTATILFGGLIMGEWIIMRLDQGEFHPGYVLPTVAGSLVAAGGAGEFGLRGLGWLIFGMGIVSWLVFTSLTLDRLLLAEMVPAPLVPSVTFEAAPAALAGSAYFDLHGLVPDAVSYGIAGYLVMQVLVQLRMLPVYRRLKFSPEFWSFTFPWSAIGAVALTWIHIERPAGGAAYSVLILAAASLLTGAIAARSLVAVARGQFLPRPLLVVLRRGLPLEGVPHVLAGVLGLLADLPPGALDAFGLAPGFQVGVTGRPAHVLLAPALGHREPIAQFVHEAHVVPPLIDICLTSSPDGAH